MPQIVSGVSCSTLRILNGGHPLEVVTHELKSEFTESQTIEMYEGSRLTCLVREILVSLKHRISKLPLSTLCGVPRFREMSHGGDCRCHEQGGDSRR